MSICKWCGEEIPKNMASYHSRVCEKNPNHEHNKKVLSDNAKNTSKKVLENGGYSRFVDEKHQKKERHLICQKCGKEYVIYCSDYQFEKGNYKKYCSSSCANSHNITDELKEKISKGVLKYHNEHNIPLDKRNENDINKFSENDINTKRYRKIYTCTKRYRKIYTCVVCGKKYYHQKGKSTRKCCSNECDKYYKEHKSDFISDETRKKLSDAGKKSSQI